MPAGGEISGNTSIERLKRSVVAVLLFFCGVVFVTCFFVHDTAQQETLVNETRWLRTEQKGNKISIQSRFGDGSAAITLDELRQEWPNWSNQERQDFTLAFASAAVLVNNNAEIVRYLIQNGDDSTHSTIALPTAHLLPSNEAISVLSSWINRCKPGDGANYYHALSFVSDEKRTEILNESLKRTMHELSGLSPDVHMSYYHVAFDAICCIESLLRCGTRPEDLRDAFEVIKRRPTKDLIPWIERLEKNF